ncbi:MAG: APC family permease [Alphaproteobacteria bacterium]|nr:APC family permease [Alphaproteobacteria bacterium]
MPTKRTKQFNLGLFSAVSLGIGSIVGAGIFALLGQVALLAGDMTYFSFLVSGIIACLCGYTYAKLASIYPQSGGLTDYFNHAFKSKWISGSLSLIYYFTSAISICTMAKSFGLYMDHLLPHSISPNLVVNFFAAVLIIGLGFLNMLGAKDVGKVETVLVVLKVGIMSALIIAAVHQFDFKFHAHPINPTTMDFFRSIGITFFAYAGFGVITNAAADVKNPQKTITRAIYLTLGIVALLYMGLAFVVLNYIPMAEFYKDTDTAVAVAADRLLGKTGYGILYIAAIIAFMSGISATFFSIFRISRSLAYQHIMPQFYKEKFWHKGSYGNLLTVCLITLATVFFDFSSIVNLSSGAYLVSYLGIFIAGWVLSKKAQASRIIIGTGFTLMFAVLIGFIVSLM